MWSITEEPYRMIWEGRCIVEGCTATTQLIGDWEKYPHNIPFFFNTTQSLPEGWRCEIRDLIVYPDINGKRGLYCPEHAPILLAYREEAMLWDAKRRALRKEHWLNRLVKWFEPAPTLPQPLFKRNIL